MNFQWQTLRTVTSQKTKSGHSTITITFSATFVGLDSINNQLRPLVAELRYMPFCYIENDFIRFSLFPEEKREGNSDLAYSSNPIVCAMQAIQISANSNSPDTLVATFQMSYFNYFPYIPSWQYKSGSVIDKSGITEDLPVNSEAWLDFVTPAIRETSPLIKIDDSSTSLRFLELRTAPINSKKSLSDTTRLLNKLSENPEPFFQHLREDIGSDTETTILQAVHNTLGDDFKDLKEIGALDLVLPILIDAGPRSNPNDPKRYRPNKKFVDESLVKNAIAEIDQRLEAKEATDGFELIPELQWSDNRGQHFGVHKKVRSVELNRTEFSSPIVITDITINIQNILAGIPLLGQRYSTYQHIGSIDASIELNIKVMSDIKLQELSWFYDTINENSLANRHIPQGLQTIHLDNPVLKLFNLREFITQDMKVTTIPGSPGTYNVQLSLVESGLKSTTKVNELDQSVDKFRMEYIANDSSTAIALAKIFTKDIKLINQKFVQSTSDSKKAAYNERLRIYLDGQNEKTPKTGITRFDERNKAFDDIARVQADRSNRGVSSKVNMSLNNFAKDVTHLVLEQEPDKYKLLLALTEEDVPGITHVKEYTYQILNKKSSQLKTVSGLTELLGKPLETQIEEAKKKVRSQEELSRIKKQRSLSRLFNRGEDVAPPKGFPLDINSNVTTAGRIAIAKDRGFQGSQDYITDKNYEEMLSGDTTKLTSNQIFNDWKLYVSNLSKDIILSGDIELPEFIELKKISKQENLGRGLPAYPDFKLERLVKGSQNIDEILNLDPDCFLFTPINSEVADFIDTSLINSATKFALESYKSATENIKDNFENEWIASALPTRIKNRIYQRANIVSKNDGKASTPIAESNTTIAAYYSPLKGSFPNAGKVSDHNIQVGNFIGSPHEDSSEVIKQVNASEATTQTFSSKRQLNHSLDPESLFTPSSITDNFISPQPSRKKRQKSNIPTGKKLTNHQLNSDGYIDISPEELAEEASKTIGRRVNVKAYLLARMIRSEEGTSNEQSRRAVALVALNDAKITYGGDLRRTLLSTGKNTKHKRNDKCGKQSGRRYSTAEDPYESDLITAELIIGGKIPDFTGGAHKFINPEIQDILGEKERQKLLSEGKDTSKVKFFADVDSDWRGDRNSSFVIPGSEHLVFYKRNKSSSLPYDLPAIKKGETQSATAGLSVLQASVNEFEKSLKNGQAMRLVRAFPTFKFYFIQDDSNNRRRYGADDLFSYNAVVDITCVRSRKIPADLVEITLTNVSGTLSNRKFQSQDISKDPSKFNNADKALNADGNKLEQDPRALDKKDTKHENPLVSMMVQPGIDVELRLGYANDPDKLTTVFVGKIMEVEFSDSDDLVRLVCQSHAIELVQDKKGLEKPIVKDGWFINDARTDRLLEGMLAEPEVVHFGRWERGNILGNTNRELLTNKFSLQPSPQDDNIFVPSLTELKKLETGASTTSKVVAGAGAAVAIAAGVATGGISLVAAMLAGAFLYADRTKYSIFHTTIWDIFEEMTLRHPGWIKAAVPYKSIYGPRMTMFFGLPSQLYFAADPSSEEINNANSLKSQVNKSNTSDNSTNAADRLKTPSLEANKKDISNLGKTPIPNDANIDVKSERLALAQDFNSIKPFRSYHLLTAKNHIISNNIRASSKNTYNTITIQYGPSDFNEDTNQLVTKDPDIFTLKADAALPDEEVRELFVTYSNCVNEQMAKNYSIAILMQRLKEAYRGEITIIGNPNIKPHDICYLFDDYSDLMGPIEVEQVIHKFSQETGFITEITPNMFVTANEWFNMTASDAMSLIMEGTTSALIHGTPTTVQETANSFTATTAIPVVLGGIARLSPLGAIATAGGGLLGSFMLQKIVDFTDTAQPIIMHPLMHHGKPLTAGLPIHKLNSLWRTDKGKWIKEGVDGIGLWWDDFKDKLQFAPNQGNIGNLFSGNTIPPKF